METLLVTGVETVTGANIAATLSDRFHVIGVTRRAGLEIEGCEIRQLTAFDSDSAVRLLRETRPAWIIECDAAAVSSWDPAPREMRDGSLVTDARLWARAAAECDCPLTFVSSDAVFSGPWMFHHEQSSSWCSSEEAEAIRAAESVTLSHCPQALVVRTCAYGWEAGQGASGWLQMMAESLEAADSPNFDCVRYATPIHASDLADMLHEAWVNRMSGILHIAGAERVNPSRFARKLALAMGLEPPRPRGVASLCERPQGYGRGETSLNSGLFRHTLGLPLPMLDDGISRLVAQLHDGYRDRLCSTPLVHQRVA
ncbi:MAG: sugar nucleotide-binding protein [Planctomycetaceae bacterium]|nr:sugar nucleotide-binding protein [Planctomycetaceae bacterium]